MISFNFWDAFIKRRSLRMSIKRIFSQRRSIMYISIDQRGERLVHSSMERLLKQIRINKFAKTKILQSQFKFYHLNQIMSRPVSYEYFRSQRNQPYGKGAYTPKEHGQEHSKSGAIKNKINQLLNLCKNENQSINRQFRDVMGAEEDILVMLKEQLNQEPSSSQYVRSNVENYSPHRHAEMGRMSKKDILKSKVQELMDENKQIKYQQSNVMKPQEEEAQYLKQEINRLRSILPKYEAEVGKIRKTGDQRVKLLDILDQGEEIRQDAIAMLKSETSGSSAGKREFLQELGKLQARCRELEEENIRLKRWSKDTDYTSVHRY